MLALGPKFIPRVVSVEKLQSISSSISLGLENILVRAIEMCRNDEAQHVSRNNNGVLASYSCLPNTTSSSSLFESNLQSSHSHPAHSFFQKLRSCIRITPLQLHISDVNYFRSKSMNLFFSEFLGLAEVVSPVPDNVDPHDLQSLLRLKESTRFVIKPADKGGGFVLMYRPIYLELIWKQLRDSSTYLPISLHNAYILYCKQIKMLVNIVKSLKDKAERCSDYSSRSLYLLLARVVESGDLSIPSSPHDLIKRIAVFYGLPKVHKHPLALRPIVASHSTPSTPLQKIIDSILNPIMKLEPTILKGSLDFINKIESKSFPPLPHNRIRRLVTGDVTSLYTNVDNVAAMKTAIRILRERMEEVRDIVPFVRLENCIDDLKSFLVAAHYCSLLQFDSKILLQLRGLGMGFADAVVLANLFMVGLDKKWLKDCKKDDVVVEFYGRFVDDIFAVVNASNEQNIFDWFKNCNRNPHKLEIKFVCSDRIVDFLDLSIFFGNRFNESGVLDLTLFRKEMAIMPYTNIKSSHPVSQKFNWIKGELIRIIRSCSDRRDFIEVKKGFFLQLLRRGYPSHIILPFLNSVSWSERQSLLLPKNHKSIPPNTILLRLPFHPNVAKQNLGKKVKESVEKWKEKIKEGKADPKLLPILNKLGNVLVSFSLEKNVRALLVRAKL